MSLASTKPLALALAAGALLALPALSVASPQSALQQVTLHTEHAQAALTQAQTLFAQGKDAQAAQSFGRSRSELGVAASAAAKLVHTASTPTERVAAAKALRLVAGQQARDIPTLAALTVPAQGSVESQIGQAALSDTTGRDKAIAILNTISGKVPEQAQAGIAHAIAALSVDRSDEVAAESQALAGDQVGAVAKSRLTSAIDQTLRGQARAAATIQALMGSLPSQAQQGLARALKAVNADQASSTHSMVTFSDRMPDAVRTFVSQIVQQAQTDPQSLVTSRPQPPVPATDIPAPVTPGAGEPTDVPAPVTPTTGAPSGVPVGPPSSVPTPTTPTQAAGHVPTSIPPSH